MRAKVSPEVKSFKAALRARRDLRKETAIASRNGLPLFQVAVNAPVIPSKRAQKLLAEDAT